MKTKLSKCLSIILEKESEAMSVAESIDSSLSSIGDLTELKSIVEKSILSRVYFFSLVDKELQKQLEDSIE